MSKPLIGLVGRRRKGARIGGFPPVFTNIDVDLYIAHYTHAVNAAGGIAVYVPLDTDPADIAVRLDGVLLTGGEDVATDLYAHRLDDATASTSNIDRGIAFDTPDDAIAADGEIPLRDAFELALLDAVLSVSLPVLGICRGIQLLTVAAGGTLHPHLPTHALVDGPPDATPHLVTTTAGSELRRLYGPEVAVNSLHHQAAERLGDGYVATAHSPDGIIEGIEHAELPIIAVQWHPELMTDSLTDPSFRWLVDHANS